jgi:dTDP-4-dehydrorhamnose 3,5-epimerase
LYVPEWCAHGFCVTSDAAEVIYKTTTEYAPQSEDGVMWNDPALGITWPVDAPLLSDRDRSWAPFGPRMGS